MARIREKKSALQKATDLLANQEQSSAVLRKKLLVRKYDAQEIDETIAKLKKYNYLDDAEACRRQFENFYSEDKLSIRQIVAKLIQRGFDKDFIAQLIPNDSDVRELKIATRLLEKKFKLTDEKTFKVKAWQFLSARGFDGEIISSAVENFLQKE